MKHRLITICTLTLLPTIAVAQGGGNAGGGQSGGQGATAGGATATDAPRTQQQRQRDSLILQQRMMRGDTGQGNQQGYHGTQGAPQPTGQSVGTQSDTGRASAQGQSQPGQDTVITSSPGSVALSRKGNLGLTTDQVKQLQNALNQEGCNSGPADGVIGPQTRHAMQCAAQQKNVSPDDLPHLLQALDLNFTPGASGGANAPSDTTRIDTTRIDTTRIDSTGMRSNPAAHAVKGDTQQTGGQNAGRVRPVSPPQTTDTSTNAQQRDTNMTNLRDTSGAVSDTGSGMNRSDTGTIRDTTGMGNRDTTGAQMRDTSSLQDTTSTQMRDTTHLRDTSTQMRDTTQSH